MAATNPRSTDDLVRNKLDLFACGCGLAFEQKVNYKSHCQNKKTTCAYDPSTTRSSGVQTICGRLISWIYLERTVAEAGLPKMVDLDKSQGRDVRAFLKPLLRENETEDSYVSLFLPLAATGPLSDVIPSLLSKWDEPIPDSVFSALEALGDKWIEEVGLHVEHIPGNLRARLLVFEGQDVGEVRQNFTFTLRQ
jgi:hypothetical protein